MNKTFLGFVLIFILLTSYNPKFNFSGNQNLKIKKIIIENTFNLEKEKLIKDLNFVYQQNLFLLDISEVEKTLKKETFVQSFSLKKIYPDSLKIIINEKKPIAILIHKEKKFYISNKGELINYINLERYKDLPVVLGKLSEFNLLFKNLKKVNFDIKSIKSFYFFKSGRWDLTLNNDKLIKLPNENYLFSLQNFIDSKNDINFYKNKVFDYRIKGQLILKK